MRNFRLAVWSTVVGALLTLPATAQVGEAANPAADETITADLANAAYFEGVLPPGRTNLVARLQVLLDRAGASPGVIDGIPGENVGNAIRAVEAMAGLPVDGVLDAAVWSVLLGQSPEPAFVGYALTPQDLAGPFVGVVPEDYAALARMESLGYADMTEMLAERFHMDLELLIALNPGLDQAPAGSVITVAAVGGSTTGMLARLEADRTLGQLRGYDAEGRLLVAYPATIGSERNPSPTGTHSISAIVRDAAYYYRPDVNFQQGNNTEPLTLPPGPNNPIGSVWIDLTEPTYGIHGTPSPDKIAKTGSHGCVRLTNWDVEELAELVAEAVTVTFQ